MPRFRVTFRKIVYDPTGHARTICQRIVTVDARNRSSAEATAVKSFCDLENVPDWVIHADWMEIARAGKAIAAPPLALRA